MAQRWQLPQSLVDAIGNHHHVSFEPMPDAKVAAAVNAGNTCAEMSDKDLRKGNETEFANPAVASILKLTQADLVQVTSDLQIRKWQIDQFLI